MSDRRRTPNKYLKRWKCCFLCTNKQTNKQSNALSLPLSPHTARIQRIIFCTPTHLFVFPFSIRFPVSPKQWHCRCVETISTSQFTNGKNRRRNTPNWKSTSLLGERLDRNLLQHCLLVLPSFLSLWQMSIDLGPFEDWVNYYYYCWVKWTSINKHQFNIVLPSLKVKQHIKFLWLNCEIRLNLFLCVVDFVHMHMINGQLFFRTRNECNHDFHSRQFNHCPFDVKASIIVFGKWRLPSTTTFSRAHTSRKNTFLAFFSFDLDGWIIVTTIEHLKELYKMLTAKSLCPGRLTVTNERTEKCAQNLQAP